MLRHLGPAFPSRPSLLPLSRWRGCSWRATGSPARSSPRPGWRRVRCRGCRTWRSAATPRWPARCRTAFPGLVSAAWMCLARRLRLEASLPPGAARRMLRTSSSCECLGAGSTAADNATANCRCAALPCSMRLALPPGRQPRACHDAGGCGTLVSTQRCHHAPTPSCRRSLSTQRAGQPKPRQPRCGLRRMATPGPGLPPPPSSPWRCWHWLAQHCGLHAAAACVHGWTLS